MQFRYLSLFPREIRPIGCGEREAKFIVQTVLSIAFCVAFALMATHIQVAILFVCASTYAILQERTPAPIQVVGVVGLWFVVIQALPVDKTDLAFVLVKFIQKVFFGKLLKLWILLALILEYKFEMRRRVHA